MKRLVSMGAFAAAVAIATATACGSDSVASPDKAVSSTGGTNGSDSTHTSPGDTSTTGNPGGQRRYPWLTITPSAASVQLHNYLALHATLHDSTGAPVAATITWRSSDEHIATVSDTGLVHGVGLGVVAIFASANGVNDSAEVAVVDTAVTQPAPPPDTSTVPDSTQRPPAPPPPPDSVPPDSAPPRDTLSSR